MVQNQRLFVSVIPQCESNHYSFSADADKKIYEFYQSYCLSRRDGHVVIGCERCVVPLGRQIVVFGVVVIFLTV